MPHLKKLSVILCLLFFTEQTLAAEWRAVISRAGFFGKFALGFSSELTPQHALDFSLGFYHMGDERYLQSNFAYRYSRWQVEVDEDVWRPLQYGLFLVHATGNQKYFIESPDVYPQSNYYDPTSIRYGIEVGTSYTWFPRRVGISYHLRIFDTGVIAIFNNSNKDLQYYISSGLSLQYLF